MNRPAAQPPSWQPSASLDVLRRRAAVVRAIRAFFEAREVLEVETPVLSRGATVDLQIDSYTTGDRWLQTSPEFAMKRLLAAGSGPIWQLARVFRVDECGRHHNPEFSLLEWYRPGWDHHRLIDECEALLMAVGAADGRCERLSYRDAFRRHAGIDPFTASAEALRAALPVSLADLAAEPVPDAIVERDFLLDLLMSHVVGPRLGCPAPLVLYDFPASQAALARVRQDDPPVAERFEIFWRGLELANGFHELTDAVEQRRRFVADQERRRAAGRPVPPFDGQLLAALEAGLPDCAGVAIGLDRLLMLLLDRPRIADVLAFDADRA